MNIIGTTEIILLVVVALVLFLLFSFVRKNR